MRIVVLSILFVLVTVPCAFAWSKYKDSFTSGEYTYHFIKCDNGQKWGLEQRQDGWIKVSGPQYSYQYSNIEDAAARLCKE